MFEKEAEEIVNKKVCSEMMCYGHCNFSNPKHHRCGNWHKCYEIAKDSAELGYHKAEEHYMNVIDDQHKLVDKSRKELEDELTRVKEKCDSLQELVNYYQTNFCQEG